MEEASPGDNLPPLHPNCRSTIAGSLYGPDDDHKRGGTRIARTAKGKSYYVPADMTHPEWEEKYVVKAQKLPKNPHVGKAVLVDITPGTNGGDTVKVYERKYILCDTEMNRRKVAEENGHEIIDKPTYCKLTNPLIKAGGMIIRGEFAKENLKQVGATASYMAGANLAFITDDATISDVLEEMYHAKQDRSNMFGKLTDGIEVLYRREIDAQK